MTSMSSVFHNNNYILSYCIDFSASTKFNSSEKLTTPIQGTVHETLPMSGYV